MNETRGFSLCIYLFMHVLPSTISCVSCGATALPAPTAWDGALEQAREYWSRVAQDSRISPRFQQVAAEALDALDALA